MPMRRQPYPNRFSRQLNHPVNSLPHLQLWNPPRTRSNALFPPSRQANPAYSRARNLSLRHRPAVNYQTPITVKNLTNYHTSYPETPAGKKDSKKGTAQYTLAKLMMNGLYGKTIQRPILDENIIIRLQEEFIKYETSQ